MLNKEIANSNLTWNILFPYARLCDFAGGIYIRGAMQDLPMQSLDLPRNLRLLHHVNCNVADYF